MKSEHTIQTKVHAQYTNTFAAGKVKTKAMLSRPTFSCLVKKEGIFLAMIDKARA